MKSCLDPGHGGSDPGCIYFGITEKDVALNIALMVRSYLQVAGVEVVMTRETDKDVYGEYASAADELQARCDISNENNCDIFLSIHCNAFGSPNPNGVQTSFFAGSAKSAKLAACVQNQMLGLGMFADRQCNGQPLHVTKYTDAVACLVELGFLSNERDRFHLTTCQDEIARALARSITDYEGMM